MTKIKLIDYKTENESFIELELIPRIGEAVFLTKEDLENKKPKKVDMVFYQPFSEDEKVVILFNSPYA